MRDKQHAQIYSRQRSMYFKTNVPKCNKSSKLFKSVHVSTENVHHLPVFIL